MRSFYRRHTTGIWITAGIIILIIAGYIGLSLFGSLSRSADRGTHADVARTDVQHSDAGESPTREDSRNTSDDATVSVQERKVIRSASLELLVSDIQKEVDQTKSLAENMNGFVESSNISGHGTEDVTASVTIRVPTDDFQKTIERLKGSVIRTNQERIRARDVTDRVADLEARLRNAQRTEEQYLSVLEQAEEVDDILQVQERLSDVRERIERLEADRKQLRRQVSMSTIDINYVSEADVKILGVVWNPWNEIKSGVNDMVQDLISFANAMIAILFALPAIILWAVFGLGILTILWKTGRWGWYTLFAESADGRLVEEDDRQ